MVSLKENEYKWHFKKASPMWLWNFFLASDYRGFMGARRNFAINVRSSSPLDLSSFSLYWSEKLYELNKLLKIIVLFKSLWYSCVTLLGYFPPFIMIIFWAMNIVRASFHYIIQYWLLAFLLCILALCSTSWIGITYS